MPPIHLSRVKPNHTEHKNELGEVIICEDIIVHLSTRETFTPRTADRKIRGHPHTSYEL